jgi:phosphoribosyl 1,2-cyclic phosphodiesterase
MRSALNSGMKIRLWGVRGSIPSPGPDTVGYGGNTSCVSIEIGNYMLVFDAGSGIRSLGDTLSDWPGPIHIFLTHLHWDHIQGLLFFGPLYQPGRALTLQTPERKMKSLEMIAGIDGLHFPLKPYQIASVIAINRRDPIRDLRAHDIRLRRLHVNHPGVCDGLRLEHQGRSLVYIPDNEIDPPYPKKVDWPRLVDFCRGADVLIHDAQYLPADMPIKRGWGHSLVSQACELGHAAGVGQLLLFHHDPTRTDAALDAIQNDARQWMRDNNSAVKCSAAAEGMEFHLEGVPAHHVARERQPSLANA